MRSRATAPKLGLEGEYDDLDENAGWTGKMAFTLFGGGVVFFLLLFSSCRSPGGTDGGSESLAQFAFRRA